MTTTILIIHLWIIVSILAHLARGQCESLGSNLICNGSLPRVDEIKRIHNTLRLFRINMTGSDFDGASQLKNLYIKYSFVENINNGFFKRISPNLNKITLEDVSSGTVLSEHAFDELESLKKIVLEKMDRLDLRNIFRIKQGPLEIAIRSSSLYGEIEEYEFKNRISIEKSFISTKAYKSLLNYNEQVIGKLLTMSKNSFDCTTILKYLNHNEKLILNGVCSKPIDFKNRPIKEISNDDIKMLMSMKSMESVEDGLTDVATTKANTEIIAVSIAISILLILLIAGIVAFKICRGRNSHRDFQKSSSHTQQIESNYEPIRNDLMV